MFLSFRGFDFIFDRVLCWEVDWRDFLFFFLFLQIVIVCMLFEFLYWCKKALIRSETLFIPSCVTQVGTLQAWLQIIRNARFRLLHSWNQCSWDQWKMRKKSSKPQLTSFCSSNVVLVLCVRFKGSHHWQTAHSWYCVFIL